MPSAPPCGSHRDWIGVDTPHLGVLLHLFSGCPSFSPFGGSSSALALGLSPIRCGLHCGLGVSLVAIVVANHLQHRDDFPKLRWSDDPHRVKPRTAPVLWVWVAQH